MFRQDNIAKKITGRNVVFPLLRACTHPYLLDAPRDENGHIVVDEDLINQSGKFILLDKMLAKLHKKGHKVKHFFRKRRDYRNRLGVDLFYVGHFSRSIRIDV